MVLGSRMPIIVIAVPISAFIRLPLLTPTCQPISAMNSTFGPGAAWARVMEAVNWDSVIQRCSSTR